MPTEPLFQYISGGPARDKLHDSLKYAYDGEKVHAIFTVGRADEPRYLVTVVIKSLSYESGQPGKYLFEADMVGSLRGRIKGYYDANKREGIFEKVLN